MGGFLVWADSLNHYIGVAMTGITWFVGLMWLLKDFFKTLKEDGLMVSLYLTVINVILYLPAAFIFLVLPNYLEEKTNLPALADWFRWALLLVTGVIAFSQTEHAEGRGARTFLFHYGILLLGWYVNRWVGMLAFSLPILLAFYYMAEVFGQSLVPLGKPDDKRINRKRSQLFLSYVWGKQPPIWKAQTHNEHEAQKKIDGKPGFMGLHGAVWMYPHQVAGLAKGPNFRAEGPGLIFLQPGEQPFELVDLRTRSGKSEIKAICREGIALTTEVFVSFAIDSSIWERAHYQNILRTNPLLRNGLEPDRNLEGKFPYSLARVKSVLSYRSKRIDPHGSEVIHRWEDHVLELAEEAALEVLSERSVEDLWKASGSEAGTAADQISGEMKELIQDKLSQHGIVLHSVRASNFRFNEAAINQSMKDAVEEQNIATWSLKWEKDQSMSRAAGQTEAERIQHEAYVYAQSAFLTAIADALKHTRAINNRLPRYVIAMRFIGVMESMLGRQSPEDTEIMSNIQQMKQKLHKPEAKGSSQ